MFTPPYSITNPNHLQVFEIAFNTLPSDIYEFFVEGYAFYMFEEKLIESADDEIEMIKYIIATRGDISLAMQNYQAESNVTIPWEGLNYYFEIYLDSFVPNRNA